MMKSWCSVSYRKRERKIILWVYYKRKRWVFINSELHAYV